MAVMEVNRNTPRRGRVPASQLGPYFEERLQVLGFNRHTFALASGISSNYINQLILGYNPGTGTPVEPTPRKLRQMAVALCGPRRRSATSRRSTPS